MSSYLVSCGKQGFWRRLLTKPMLGARSSNGDEPTSLRTDHVYLILRKTTNSMKSIPLGIIISTFLTGCTSFILQPNETGDTCQSGQTTFIDYRPIDPIPIKYFPTAQGQIGKLGFPSDARAIRETLPNQTSTTIIRKVNADGKVSYLSSFISAEVGKYEVIIDYAKFRTEMVNEEYGKVGVGVRIRANIETLKKGVNLNGLIALGVAANQELVRGTISVDVIGIDSPGVNSLLPISLKLDETSIQTALQSLSSIQTKIYDQDVKLTPQLLAVRAKDPIVGPIDLSTQNAHSQLIRTLKIAPQSE